MALATVTFQGGRDAAAAAPLDLLCIAPHPDDAELGMGGTLARHAGLHWRVGVCDLTAGELSSNGTPALRQEESAAASAVLALAWRGNLGLPDRGLRGPEAERALVGVLRLLRPALLFIPAPEDPHPDHTAACALCLEAAFSAGLRRYAGPDWSASCAPHRPRAVLHYCINGWRDPALVIDVGPWYEAKQAAIAAFASQFAVAPTGGVVTRLNSGAATAQVLARDRFLGAQAGVNVAEGFIPARPLLLPDLSGLRGGDAA